MKIRSLEIKKMCFEYKSGGSSVNVFKDLSYVFPTDKFIQLAGPTGAGKGTLLKIIATLLDPDKGQYLINDNAIESLDEAGKAPFRQAMGYIGPNFGLIQNKTCLENLQLSFHSFPEISSMAAESTIQQIVAELQIESVLDKRPTEIPRSAALNVATARALVHKPQMLIIALSLDNKILDFLFTLLEEKRLGSIFYTGDLSMTPPVPHLRLLVSSDSLQEAA